MSTTAPLAWSHQPDSATNYVNSVGISADGSRVITGTFSHSYSQTSASPSGSRAGAVKTATSDDTYGTYCYDESGTLLWQWQFSGYEGVYWTAINLDGTWAASGGWYSGSPNYDSFIALFKVAGNGTPEWLQLETTGRISFVGFAPDNSCLVAGSNTVYVFSAYDGSFSRIAITLALPQSSGSSYADAVQAMLALPGGEMVIVGTVQGHLYGITISGGAASITSTWNANGGIHSLAMASDGSQFVSGQSGGFAVFNTAEFFGSSSPTPNWLGTVPETTAVYGVAMSGNGYYISAVGNTSTGGNVALYSNIGSSGELCWTFPTDHNPNSTSIDANGVFVGVADGHPDGTPGAFYCLQVANGELLWSCPTGNMSWPCMINTKGTAMVAGSDDSYVYYFAPLVAPVG